MAGKRIGEIVFKVVSPTVAVGLFIAHFVTGEDSYLTYAFLIVVASLPIELMFWRARRARAQ